MIFTIVTPVLLAILLYSLEIIRGVNLLFRGIFSPVIDEQRYINRQLTSQMEANGKKINDTEEALQGFSAAISQYARHLSSHTSAVQGLAEASQELKLSSAAQNRVLMDLMKSAEEASVRREELLKALQVDLTPTEKPAPAAENPRCEKALPSYRSLHQLVPAKTAPEVKKPAPEAKKTAPEAANLVEAMVLPYYRALHKLEKGKSPSEAEKKTTESEELTDRVKKAVETIMFPFYRTLYQTAPDNSLPPVEKPDETKEITSRHPSDKLQPRVNNRWRHPRKPW